MWVDKNLVVQYHVPPELACLREGEKLLIQQVSVYVPLHHLMYGQIGCRGHIVSFPQSVSSVCTTLPRLPKEVDIVRVIKRFKLGDGEISSKSFMIRKPIVMKALIWLKTFNDQYKDICICEENMDWIENGEEQILPASICKDELVPGLLCSDTDEDLGPSPQQISEQVHATESFEPTSIEIDVELGTLPQQLPEKTHDSEEFEPTYGFSSEFNYHTPKQKDRSVMEALTKAEMQGKLLNIEADGKTIHFPYVSAEPVCEFDEKHLFEYAFPWLFPGGHGGYMSGPNPKPLLKDWLKIMSQYKDGRFDNDRLWSFFALNYSTRHNNNGSGSFFVKTFFKNGPQTLEALQEQVSEGQLEWLDRISYYSARVIGSSAFWRSKRREVFAWINYHMEKKNGLPTFFITLSCAEYHWKDIERLIQERCMIGGLPPPDFSKGKFSHTPLYQHDSIPRPSVCIALLFSLPVCCSFASIRIGIVNSISAFPRRTIRSCGLDSIY